MKRLFILFVLAFVSLALFNTEADAQCKQQVVYQCATSSDNGIYLRDFNTKLKRDAADEETGMKWSQHLNMNTKYKFTLCAQEGFQDQVVLTLYDSSRPENSNPYECTFDKEQNTDKKSFEFICTKAGIYYISIRFKPGQGSKKACAVGILSFKGKVTAKDLENLKK